MLSPALLAALVALTFLWASPAAARCPYTALWAPNSPYKLPEDHPAMVAYVGSGGHGGGRRHGRRCRGCCRGCMAVYIGVVVVHCVLGFICQSLSSVQHLFTAMLHPPLTFYMCDVFERSANDNVAPS